MLKCRSGTPDNSALSAPPDVCRKGRRSNNGGRARRSRRLGRASTIVALRRLWQDQHTSAVAPLWRDRLSEPRPGSSGGGKPASPKRLRNLTWQVPGRLPAGPPPAFSSAANPSRNW